MATVEQKWSALPVPHAIEAVDRIPKERYYDADFFGMERELLWPRVWQMACRLEEIPNPGDFAEYQILDKSVIVIRTADTGVQAFENTCRHRGVRIIQGRGTADDGFTCPFHGWCYGLNGRNTRVTQASGFFPDALQAGQIDLVPVRSEAWGGMAWINFDEAAPPLRECIEPFATIMDGWHLEAMRAEWWLACRLPANWKLAQEAFVEQYHVLETHPQLRIPGRYAPRNPADFDPRTFVEGELQYLRTMCDGMEGMVHANDVRIAEQIQGMDLPGDYAGARAIWDRNMNAAVTETHRSRGCVMPDINDLEARGWNHSMIYAFPHVFILPMYSSATAYRFRPLGPEETLMELWSLTRFPEGEEPETPPVPDWWAPDDDRWPPIPTQDFSNIPRQQLGLRNPSFEFMRLSARDEGHISNFHRVIDGYLAGLAQDQLLSVLPTLNVNPLEMAVAEIAFT
jgi:phenylpropionate dioxygenase-like ring-hydroxylating dioxygenase large terminal subunit